jgi:hypothetical protein
MPRLISSILTENVSSALTNRTLQAQLPEFLDITRDYTLYTRRFNEYATQPGD